MDMLCPKCQSKQGLLRCKNCFSRDVLCHTCCLVVHQNLPFHSIEKWTGCFFQVVSLNEEGLVLYLGHGGTPCPGTKSKTGICTQETQANKSADKGTMDEELGAWEADNKKCLTVIDISGVHQLCIGWCQCEDAPGADVQLLRSRLFPASISNPSTAFTFGLLDYFHIDSVECKTSALSFFSKLWCLTNNYSPDSVPVGLLNSCPS